MATIAILLATCLVTVIAVIGVADALAHLLGWTVRALRAAAAPRAGRALAGMARRGRVAA
jgi:hypothetical protein